MRPFPKPAPATVLAAARAYVDRYAPTEHGLRAHLARKVQPAAEAHGIAPDEVRAWIDAAVARLVAVGFVDDRRWAESRVRALRRRGSSTRAIRSALASKGVTAEVVEAALAVEEVEPDLEAARLWARKHRIGPWRTAPVDADGRRRELARLARKGFSYDVARRALQDTE